MSTDVVSLRRALSNPAGLAQALGLPMKRQARGVVVCCPWHDEKTPSCSITVRGDGTIGVRCFGCQHTADALSLIAEVNGLDARRDFARVVEIATGIAGGSYMAPERAPRVQVEPPRLADEIFDRIASQLVPVDDAVRAYLAGRCLDADAVLSVPNGFARAAVADVGPEAWERSGMSGWPRHRLALAWRRPDGLVTTVQRRTLGTDEPKYVFARGRSPRFPFGIERAPGPCTTVVFVEGALDVIALRTLAARNGRDWLVLGVPGVGNWDRAWAHYGRDRSVILAFDADKAGDGLAVDVAEQLHPIATRVSRLRPKHGKDWCDELIARERAA
jgi:DNA primase